MKRAFCFLALFFCLTFFVACGGNPSPYDSSKTLTILGKKSDLEKSYMTRLFSLYEEKTNNTLDIVSIEDAKFEETATDYFAKGYIPDIFMHFHNADLNRFDVVNNFLSLNGESWVSDLTDSARAYCTDSNGNLLGLPFWESSVSGCYYNKTLLDRLGLKPATTQEEFDMLCLSLKEIGYTPICWPANGCSWMYQFALDPVFCDHPDILQKLNNGEINYADIPEFEKMATWIQNAALQGWFGNDYLKTGWNEISSVMNSGAAVMTFIWDTWFYTDFKPAEYSVDDFGVMPVFMNTVEEGTFEGGNLNMMMLNKNSNRLNEAREFLNFCASPEIYNACFEGISTVSSFKGMTTNIESSMVKEARASIAKKERVSTASTRVIGYSADDFASAFNDLFHKRKDIRELIRELDSMRASEIQNYFAKE